jgi:lipopolysaccharide biosynthesis regulator YciM
MHTGPGFSELEAFTMADDDQQMREFDADFAFLVESGFVAVKQLDETSATRIFHAAQLISPKSTAPRIGLGWIALNKLEVKEAAAIFEKVCEQEPENHLAQVFLGICFVLTKPKRKKGEKLIRDAMDRTADPTIKNLGEISLEWARKDLSKKEAPFNFAKPSGDEKNEE